MLKLFTVSGLLIGSLLAVNSFFHSDLTEFTNDETIGENSVGNAKTLSKHHSKQARIIKQSEAAKTAQAQEDDIAPQQVKQAANYEPNIVKNIDAYLGDVYATKAKNDLVEDGADGHLVVREGVIESLEVIFSNGDMMVASFAKMEGNTFRYNYEGLIYSGLIYKTKSESYMVTLANGPFSGVRLKFLIEDAEIGEVDSTRATSSL